MAINMPGTSFRGQLPPLTNEQDELAKELEQHVVHLATTIGERHVALFDTLDETVDYLDKQFTALSPPKLDRQTYTAHSRDVHNLILEIPGTDRKDEIVVVGAHFDSAPGTPAANDNGSAVAATLALAKRMVGKRYPRTLRFVLFTNEEPPFFQTELMGSLVYAKACKAKNENIVAMLALETMGYYSDIKGSQKYPAPFSWFYPDTGDFIGFISNFGSRKLVRYTVKQFRTHAQFPSEGCAAPGFITGVGWSDHWSFWMQGYPSVMVTDTAPFRYPYYHTAQDTPDKIDFQKLARVVTGLKPVIEDLVTQPELK